MSELEHLKIQYEELEDDLNELREYVEMLRRTRKRMTEKVSELTRQLEATQQAYFDSFWEARSRAQRGEISQTELELMRETWILTRDITNNVAELL